MSDICKTPFGTWAPIYRKLGLWPRPLIGKACKFKGWSTPDPELPIERTEEWDRKHAALNLGLLMGSTLSDGTLLGALDIDHDDYVGLGRTLLNNPPCGRIGKKGAVFFVRILPSLASQKFRVKEDDKKYGQVLECLFQNSVCAIPPSIHPETQQPYRWIGTSLLEMNFNKLPLIGE